MYWTRIAKEKNWHDIDSLKTHEEIQELQELRTYFLEDVDDLRGLYPFLITKEEFPEEIMFFTTDELGIMAFNKLEDNSYLIGVSGSPVIADGDRISTFGFFAHDLNHMEASQVLEAKIPKKILGRIDGISSKSDREKVELALFIYRHESEDLSLSGKLTQYYTDSEIHSFSQDDLERFKSSIRKEYQELMEKHETRFFDSDDLQVMLPESVNVNNKEEVKKFLDEAVDVVVDILLAH